MVYQAWGMSDNGNSEGGWEELIMKTGERMFRMIHEWFEDDKESREEMGQLLDALAFDLVSISLQRFDLLKSNNLGSL